MNAGQITGLIIIAIGVIGIGMLWARRRRRNREDAALRARYAMISAPNPREVLRGQFAHQARQAKLLSRPAVLVDEDAGNGAFDGFYPAIAQMEHLSAASHHSAPCASDNHSSSIPDSSPCDSNTSDSGGGCDSGSSCGE